MNREKIMGFDFVVSSFSEILDSIRTKNYATKKEMLPFLITPNADQILRYNTDFPELMTFYKNSYFILPDGAPIVLFSKLRKGEIKSRLAGSDFFPLIWRMAIEEKKNVFAVVPNQKAGEMLKGELDTFDYYVPGFFKVEDSMSFDKEVKCVVEKIRGCPQVDLIIIGLGFPKQEILAKKLYEILPSGDRPALYLLLGASFEFYLGLKKRAPLWVQRVHLEWLHRLMSEPTRLWKRYTVGNLKFIVFFMKNYLKRY